MRHDGRDRTWLATGTLLTLGATMLIWLTAIVLLPRGGAFLLSAAFASAIGCTYLSIWLSPRPFRASRVALSGCIGLLAGLAPFAAVLFIRLSVRGCVVLNLFGLPWDEPWRSIMHATAGVVWFAGIALVVTGLVVDRGLRSSAVAMAVWSAVAAPLAVVLLFLSFYGDPAPGCVPA